MAIKYNTLILSELEEYGKDVPDFTFREILCSILRTMKIRETNELLSEGISDEDIYNAIIKSKQKELYEPFDS